MIEPVITVITPVGPRHPHYLPDAIASVQAQPIPSWEHILVNDSGRPLDLPALPGVRIMDAPAREPGQTGPARAAVCRNKAIQEARGVFTVFLDADDALTDEAFVAWLRGILEYPEASYVYGGWFNLAASGAIVYAPPPAYDRARLTKVWPAVIHPVTCLVPTEAIRAMGGFDARWDLYEDWDFWVRMALSGYCGQPIQAGTLVYRNQAGSNREESHARRGEVPARFAERYGAIARGELKLMGCCGSGAKAQAAARRALGEAGIPLGGGPASLEDAMEGGRIRMEAPQGLSGFIANPFGGGSGERYRVTAGNGRYISAHPQDVAWLTDRGFTVVKRPSAEAAPPIPAVVQPMAQAAKAAPTTTPEPAPEAAEPGEDVVAEGTPAESRAPRKKARP